MDKALVLFVDDDLRPDDNREDEDNPDGDYMWYYTSVLSEAGHEVTRALDPDEALAKLSTQEAYFDLVILDIMMPPGQAYRKEKTLNGTRTGSFLAKTLAEKYPELPVVVLTNVDDPNVHQSLSSLGNVRAVFTKSECLPFRLVEVVQEL